MGKRTAGNTGSAMAFWRYLEELFWPRVRTWISAVHPLPILAAVAIAFLLGGVGQLFELYTVLAEEIRAGNPGHTVLAVAALVLLSCTIFIANRALGRFRVTQVFADHHDDVEVPGQSLFVNWTGIIAAGLPWVGVLHGVTEALTRAVVHIGSVSQALPESKLPSKVGAEVGSDGLHFNLSSEFVELSEAISQWSWWPTLSKYHEQALPILQSTLVAMALLALIALATVLANCRLRHWLVSRWFYTALIAGYAIIRSFQEWLKICVPKPESSPAASDPVSKTEKIPSICERAAESWLVTYEPALLIVGTFIILRLIWGLWAGRHARTLPPEDNGRLRWRALVLNPLFLTGIVALFAIWRVFYVWPVHYEIDTVPWPVVAEIGIVGALLLLIWIAPLFDREEKIAGPLSDKIKRFDLRTRPRITNLCGRFVIVLAATIFTLGSIFVPWLLAQSRQMCPVDQDDQGGWCQYLTGPNAWLDFPGLLDDVGVSGWAVVVIVITALGFVGYVTIKERSSLGRIATAVASAIAGVCFLLAIVVVVTGLSHFGWVEVARAFGPLAMMIVTAMAIFAMLVAIARTAQLTGVPFLIILGLMAGVVIAAKLGSDYQVWSLALLVLLSVLFFVLYQYRGGKRAPLALALVLLGIAFLPFWEGISAKPTDPAHGAQSSRSDEAPERLVKRFDDWYRARTKLAGNKPYPVFIVALEGGGIYAATASSTFLARMQEQEPNFASHLFAISSVSGGAIGATLFNSGLIVTNRNKQAACNDIKASEDSKKSKSTEATNENKDTKEPKPNYKQHLNRFVDRVVKEDHLSPLLGLIIPDILGTLDRKSGSEIGDPLELIDDRAWGLGRSLRESLNCDPSKHQGNPIWDGRYSQHWDPAGNDPALVFNTTWVRVGNRVAFAPFTLQDPTSVTLNTFAESDFQGWKDEYNNIPLLEAAVVSARFPGIVPAFEVIDRPAAPDTQPGGQGGDDGPSRWYFVDGGYVDASGAMTAYDIYRTLSREKSKRDKDGDPQSDWNIDLRLILLSSTQSDKDTLGKQTPDLKDLTAPFVALFSVRGLLSRIAAKETIAKVVGDVERTQQLEAVGDRDALVDSRRTFYAENCADNKRNEKIRQIDVENPLLPFARLCHPAQHGETEDWAVTVVELNQEDFQLELGWKISGLTHEVVSLQLGHPDLCQELKQSEAGEPRLLQGLNKKTDRDEEIERKATEVKKTIRANSCVMSSIRGLIERAGQPVDDKPVHARPGSD
ncbi:MAG: patatin-like phospholipase family protein [Alphaproteobacteria bacterium]|nr:patatin-like phospholipase family protein [Alphaproteobacteria bacterium]